MDVWGRTYKWRAISAQEPQGANSGRSGSLAAADLCRQVGCGCPSGRSRSCSRTPPGRFSGTGTTRSGCGTFLLYQKNLTSKTTSARYRATSARYRADHHRQRQKDNGCWRPRAPAGVLPGWPPQAWAVHHAQGLPDTVCGRSSYRTAYVATTLVAGHTVSACSSN